MFYIFSLNHIFDEIELDNISDQQSITAEVVRVLIHGHSLYDEAAFYELYITGAIDSKRSLDNFIGSLIPGFKGLTGKQFDLVMSKWLYHLLAQFWTRSFQTGRSFGFRQSTICFWNCSFRYPSLVIIWGSTGLLQLWFIWEHVDGNININESMKYHAFHISSFICTFTLFQETFEMRLIEKLIFY